MRRGLKALNSVFGNKIAILAGDFLLARASVSLAALRDSEVIQLLSQVIEDLVTGEILQVCVKHSPLAFEYVVPLTWLACARLPPEQWEDMCTWLSVWLLFIAQHPYMFCLTRELACSSWDLPSCTERAEC